MVRAKKKDIVKMFLFHHSRSLLLYNVCTTYVDTIQSMNGIVCSYNLLCFENNMTKKSNLMILDKSGIYYSRMLLFVLDFLVYWKIDQILKHSRASGNTCFTTKWSHLNCQNTKCDVTDNNF